MNLELNTSAEGPNAGMEPMILEPIRVVWKQVAEAVELLRRATRALEIAEAVELLRRATRALEISADFAFPEWYEPVGQRQRDRQGLRETLAEKAREVDSLRARIEELQR